ncbi:hypothetical protein COE25_24950, partial [Bacillus sp. AFS031507]
ANLRQPEMVVFCVFEDLCMGEQKMIIVPMEKEKSLYRSQKRIIVPMEEEKNLDWSQKKIIVPIQQKKSPLR